MENSILFFGIPPLARKIHFRFLPTTDVQSILRNLASIFTGFGIFSQYFIFWECVQSTKKFAMVRSQRFSNLNWIFSYIIQVFLIYSSKNIFFLFDPLHFAVLVTWCINLNVFFFMFLCVLFLKKSFGKLQLYLF